MGLADVVKNREPQENPEFGNKKKLIGDAVCTGELEKITSKAGRDWIIFRLTAINCIPDEQNRPTTIEPGDEVTFLYDPTDDARLQQLQDDLFTAGVEYDKAGEDEMILDSMATSVAKDGQLFYVRTWAKDKRQKDIDKYGPDPSYFQNQKVLSKNKLTPENSVAVTPF